MFVAGVDGCRGGWVAFRVELPSRATSVEIVDLPAWLQERPPDLTCLGIDIPIGLCNGSRACDKAARKLLAQPRGTSVFAAPCRATLSATTHAAASLINHDKTGRGLSQQAFGIIPKIKQVASVITSKAANGYHFKTGQRDWPSRTENVLPCRLLWWQVGFGSPAARAAFEYVAVV